MRRGALAVGVLLLALGGPGVAQDGGPATAMPDLDQPIAPPANGALPDEALPNRTIAADEDAGRLVAAPLLTVDQDRLFTESAWGKRALLAFEENGRRIAEDNERLAEQLSAEEALLTRQRAGMEPGAFRQRAEAFDTRATTVRRERAQAVQELNAGLDADRTAFYQAALPVMGALMQQRGAVAVLDRRTVFVSLDAIDITSDLISRLDATLGEGPAPTQAPPPDDAPGEDAPEIGPGD